MAESLVWYLAYGSNLCRDRFITYVQGGTPEGGRRGHAGARDPSTPRDDRPVTLAHPLYFAGPSRTWGGGVAFIDPARRPGTRTLARAWLITVEQFEDVVGQERGVPSTAIDLGTLARDGVAALGDGRYGTLVAGDAIDGITALTCTAPAPGPDGPVIAPPALDYLRTIARGLEETHGLAPVEAAAYLTDVPGARERWPHTELAAAFGEPARSGRP